MGIIEQGFQRNPIKNYNTYIANSFSELPLDAPVGSQGIFSSDDGFGVAVKFDYFWCDSSGNKLYANVDLDIDTQKCSVELTVGGAPVQSLKYADTATITATADTGYTLTSLKVNGEAFTSGSTLTVNGDIVIEAVAEETPEPSGYTWDGVTAHPNDISAENYNHFVSSSCPYTADEYVGATVKVSLNGETYTHTVTAEEITSDGSGDVVMLVANASTGEIENCTLFTVIKNAGELAKDGLYLSRTDIEESPLYGAYTASLTLAE